MRLNQFILSSLSGEPLIDAFVDFGVRELMKFFSDRERFHEEGRDKGKNERKKDVSQKPAEKQLAYWSRFAGFEYKFPEII